MVPAARAKALLSQHGITRSQPASDWSGPFPLPPALERFYADVGPVDVSVEGNGTPYMLPSLSRLWEFQAGYAYNGVSGEPLPGWSEDWIVVADEGGDPFVLSRESGQVMLLQHGDGAWEADELFDDLNAMAGSLAVLGSIVVAAGDSLTDDCFQIRPVHVGAAVKQLRELLGSREEADVLLAMLGWG